MGGYSIDFVGRVCKSGILVRTYMQSIMENATVRGIVVEILPAALYRVQVEDREILCYLSGKMKFNRIRVLLGDKVDIVLDPYKGKATNRIVKRV